ncbi:hypothetical protein FRC07_001588 [Ceratobasidium sp. 392]|nr:hypothetical protein FRC07_001588 [Ceratobasidium sp. 392]
MPPVAGRFASTNPYAGASGSPAASTQDLLASEKPSPVMMSPYGSGPSTPNTSRPFLGRRASASTLSDKFSLAADPRQWGANLSMQDREPDDELHNPDPRRDHRIDRGGTICTTRGILNLGCLAILSLGLLMLFAGYPLLSYFMTKPPTTNGGFNIGGVNATGQFPDMIGNFGLIDKDTPTEAYTRKSIDDGSEWDLVFSDEFNTDGRTFYPGDDPYWEATDLHYWGTNNLEWYDPSALTTVGGSLKVTLSKSDPPYHGLNYMGGMMSTWNKFCFTGGYFEANVSLPGSTKAYGLWPAIWAMGNLGRAGYGASLDGTWPYTYDTCDVGTLANQSFTDTTPPGAHKHGDAGKNGELSFLPGQRLSACTCKGEPHPGPTRPDGTFVGRAAPEIDMFEAQIVNLGISPNFGAIDWDNLVFPTFMLVDWIRVYQPKDAHNIGCDPPDFPTADYINTFIEAYTNPNMTTWVDDYGQVIPKNRLVDNCT